MDVVDLLEPLRRYVVEDGRVPIQSQISNNNNHITTIISTTKTMEKAPQLQDPPPHHSSNVIIRQISTSISSGFARMKKNKNTWKNADTNGWHVAYSTAA